MIALRKVCDRNQEGSATTRLSADGEVPDLIWASKPDFLIAKVEVDWLTTLIICMSQVDTRPSPYKPPALTSGSRTCPPSRIVIPIQPIHRPYRARHQRPQGVNIPSCAPVLQGSRCSVASLVLEHPSQRVLIYLAWVK